MPAQCSSWTGELKNYSLWSLWWHDVRWRQPARKTSRALASIWQASRDLINHDWFFIAIFSILTSLEGSELSQWIDLYYNLRHSDRPRGIWVITIDWLILHFSGFWQGARDVSYHKCLTYTPCFSIITGLEGSASSQLIGLYCGV